MNAIVEVATAEVVAEAGTITVITVEVSTLEAITPKVAASTRRVLSIAGTSISAVSPDYNFIGGTA